MLQATARSVHSEAASVWLPTCYGEKSLGNNIVLVCLSPDLLKIFNKTISAIPTIKGKKRKKPKLTGTKALNETVVDESMYDVWKRSERFQGNRPKLWTVSIYIYMWVTHNVVQMLSVSNEMFQQYDVAINRFFEIYNKYEKKLIQVCIIFSGSFSFSYLDENTHAGTHACTHTHTHVHTYTQLSFDWKIYTGV